MINFRVMNNLADNKKPAIFENFACSIRKIDRALDPVAKTELFRQAHGGIAHGNDSTRPAHLLHNVTAIVRFDLLLHRGHYIRRAEVHFLPRGRAAGNQVRTHDFGQRNPNWPFSNGRPSAEISLSADDHWSTSTAPGGSLNQLGESNTERGGSGSRLWSSRSTRWPYFSSSGNELAISTGVPIRTKAKSRAAASRWRRTQPWVCATGQTNPS